MAKKKWFVVMFFFVASFGFSITPASAATDGWHIADGATGGECSLIGGWDATSKTCTLSQDLNQGIIIDSDNVTLDGNGHTLTGYSTGIGVWLYLRSGVVVKNLSIKNFGYGINLYYSSSNTFERNTISNNGYGIVIAGSNNTLKNNIVNKNSFTGIALSFLSSNSTLIDNVVQENTTADITVTNTRCDDTLINTIGSGGRQIKYFNSAVNLSNETFSELILCNADGSNIRNITIDGSLTQNNNGLFLLMTDLTNVSNINSSNNNQGITLSSSNNNTIVNNIVNSEVWGVGLSVSNGNIISGNTASGLWGILLSSSNNNVITGNTAYSSYWGIGISGSSNKIYNNNFFGQFYSSSGENNNIYNFSAPIGGNYWSNFDTSAEGCNDANADGFCDAPYIFTGGQDNLPWTKKDGWGTPPPIDSDKDCISDDEERQIGTDPNNTDTDGDGLFDGWEAKNLDMENSCQPLDFDLVGAGANPLHKDIFLEIDWMEDATHNQKPSMDAVKKVVTAFNEAPVSNPNRIDGIILHVDLSNAVAYQEKTSFDIPLLESLKSDFDEIKENNFSVNRKKIFRYALFAHNISRFGFKIENSGVAEVPGNDLMVTLGSFTDSIDTASDQAGTLMHELGHTLGLHHGGGDDVNLKPNYLSVMNYLFQFTGISYFNTASSELPDSILDYSRLPFIDIDENHLNEGNGISGDNTYTYHYCGGIKMRALGNSAIDWNCNKTIDDTPVAVSVNNDTPKEALHAHDDWHNITYRFQDLNDYADGVRNDNNVVDVSQELTPAMVTNLSLDLIPFTVEVDFKPGSSVNPINLNSEGVSPIVLFGSSKLDVNTVKIDSINVSGASAVQASTGDMNNDGIPDLLLKVPTKDMFFLGNSSENVTLVAKTKDKRILYGVDKITVVPK